MGVELSRLSITQRLSLLTTVALVPALAILIYYLTAFHQQRVREIDEQALRLGQLASLEMKRILSGSEGILRTVARAPAVRRFETKACSSFVADIGEQLPQFTGIATLDATGLLRCRGEMPAEPPMLADRSYFPSVMQTGDFVIVT